MGILRLTTKMLCERVIGLEMEQMVTLAIGAFITAVVGSVVSWFKGTYNSYTDKLKERDRIITDLQLTNKELQSELTEQNRIENYKKFKEL